MPELKVRYADYHQLLSSPRKEGRRDRAILSSPPIERHYKAPIFVDHLQHVPSRNHPLTVSEFARKLPPLVYLELYNACLVERWGIVSEFGDCYWSVAPENMRNASAKDGFAPKPGKGDISYKYDIEHYAPGETLFLPINAPHISHFYFQVLPHLATTPSGTRKLFMRVREKPYFSSLLDILGFNSEEVTYAPFQEENRHQIWRFEKLVVPVFWAAIHPLHESIFTVMGQLADPKPGNGRRIYISRADARSMRVCLNEEEIISIAQRKGLDILECSKMTELDKIATFRAAEFVMGSVGSGMYNTLFRDQPSLLFALNGASYTDLMLRECASIRNHTYGLHLCPEILSFDRAHSGMHNDFVAHLPTMEKRLDSMLKSLDQRRLAA